MNSRWITAMVIAATLGATSTSHATPVTWTLTGTAAGGISAFGSYAGLPGLPAGPDSVGQEYQLIYTFQDGVAGACGFFGCGPSSGFVSFFNAGDTATVLYGGYSFTVGPGGSTRRDADYRASVDNVPGHFDGELSAALSDATVGHGGNAVTNLPGVTDVQIVFQFENHDQSFLLGNPPTWPTSITLDDFWFRNFGVVVTGPDSSSGFNIFIAPQAFSTFRSSADAPPTDVPEPGSAGLIVLGLLGLRAARRKRPCASAVQRSIT